MLAPHMHHPREAKKLLSKIFAAPGKVAVTEHGVHVRLSPAASKSQLVAIQHLFDVLNQRGLILGGDMHFVAFVFLHPTAQQGDVLNSISTCHYEHRQGCVQAVRENAITSCALKHLSYQIS
jgi:hypothetical protein